MLTSFVFYEVLCIYMHTSITNPIYTRETIDAAAEGRPRSRSATSTAAPSSATAVAPATFFEVLANGNF